MSETATKEPTQLAITFPLDKKKGRDLLPLGAVSTAIKVVRARKRRAEHAKEPMHYDLQDHIERFVKEHLEALEAGKKAAAEALAASTIPDMPSAEARRLAGDELADAIQRGEITLTTGERRG
jgi:hypothetical protein